MKLLLATDAWFPQVNGVVTTLSTVVKKIEDAGHQVEVVSPNDYLNFPLPTYAEIRIAAYPRGLKKRIDAFDPDAIHISTEGPIGQFVRRFCKKRGYVFTTSFHTRFPEYIEKRIPIPSRWTYPVIRKFHQSAFRTLVPTKTLRNDLLEKGFGHMEIWGRGVDTTLFHPKRKQHEFEQPVMLNVGRVAPEKNLEAFLDLDIPGTKIVVGQGPSLNELKSRYPDVIFPGVKQGIELAEYYASADVFVFPSLTDTFGLVMLESIASGTPVAAFPVTGPLDVLQPGKTGEMHQDLASAIEKALLLDRTTCREEGKKKDWKKISDQFLRALMPIHSDKNAAIKEAQWENQDIQE